LAIILIVASTRDKASMNIRRQLLANYDFLESTETFCGRKIFEKTIKGSQVRLVTIDEEPIYYQAVAEDFDPQLAVFISRHSSKSGTPTLSVHTPGNLAQAQKGGIPKKVSIAPAAAMKEALLELARQKARLSLSYEVSYECTHHGPSLDVPAMFVELGSSPAQWKDQSAAEAVAHAAMASISKTTTSWMAVVGIGGPHYNEKFTRFAVEGFYAFGHIIPKYAVSQVDVRIVKQCIDRTMERVRAIILDWKGIKGADKATLAQMVGEAGVEVQKI